MSLASENQRRSLPRSMVQTRVFPGSNRLFARRGGERIGRTDLGPCWLEQVARTAAMLGLSRKGIYNLLERYEAGAPSWRHTGASHNGRNGTRRYSR